MVVHILASVLWCMEWALCPLALDWAMEFILVSKMQADMLAGSLAWPLMLLSLPEKHTLGSWTPQPSLRIRHMDQHLSSCHTIHNLKQRCSWPTNAEQERKAYCHMYYMVLLCSITWLKHLHSASRAHFFLILALLHIVTGCQLLSLFSSKIFNSYPLRLC